MVGIIERKLCLSLPGRSESTDDRVLWEGAKEGEEEVKLLIQTKFDFACAWSVGL